MFDFIRYLFDTSLWPPRWHCGAWSNELGWFHIFSDTAIWGAYTAIPLSLAYFILKRRDLPFTRIFWLFACFIFSCGSTHLLDAALFWWPAYRLSAFMRFVTATVSWVTVFALIRHTPKALELPGLARMNAQLQTEIQERRRAEERLREREEFLSAIFQNVLDGVMTVDAAGKILSFNPSVVRFFGYSESEFAEKSLSELIPGDLPNESPTFESHGLRSDGKLFPMELSLSKIDVGGRSVVAVVVRDITERRKAEEERQKMEQQFLQVQKLESLGVLAGGIAHDFNNLLVGMLGNASMAVEEISEVSPARHYVDGITTAAKSAADLCRQLLAYSGRGRFIIEKISVNSIVREMKHLLGVTITRGVVLNLNLGENISAVEADATQIRQIVMNLVTNASEAIGKRSGAITITTGEIECDAAYLKGNYAGNEIEEGKYVFIEIADNGEGISPENLAKIFDPFYTTKFTGRGLGLAAVLGIVRSHRGGLRVSSEPGRGTTFRILLPSTGEPARETTPPPTKTPQPIADACVLLVDDSATVRTVARKVLENSGFRVIEAEDGREGIESFRQYSERIHCVLLDLTMPKMDGYQVFEALRSINPVVPVILSSGYNEQEAVGQFQGKGLAGFIQKPYQKTDLLNMVTRVILKSRQTPTT